MRYFLIFILFMISSCSHKFIVVNISNYTNINDCLIELKPFREKETFFVLDEGCKLKYNISKGDTINIK